MAVEVMAMAVVMSFVSSVRRAADTVAIWREPSLGEVQGRFWAFRPGVALLPLPNANVDFLVPIYVPPVAPHPPP